MLIRLLLTSMLCLTACQANLFAQKKVPADQQGFEMKLFAQSPDVRQPTGVSVSPEGAVFVSCDQNGAGRGGKTGLGKVIRCVDTDGDGKADQFTDFITGIDSPRGSCYVDDTLYLVRPPYLTAYQDTNGDGKADKEKHILKGLGHPFEKIRVDHGQNGVHIGIDGWLYIVIGDQGVYNTTGTDGSKVTIYGGGVLRCRLDGSNVEVVAINTRNTYGIAISPYLDIFTRDNTNDGLGWDVRFHHITALADYGYPRLYKYFGHELRKPLIDYGGGSGAGMYYVHDPGFPEAYGDTIYSNDFGRGVFIHPRKRHEASFQIQQKQFLKFARPMDTDMDGASRMYVVTFGKGPLQFNEKPAGEVYQITYPSRQANQYPNLSNASEAKLVEHLTGPAFITRINAMTTILKQGPKPAFTKALLAASKDSSKPLYARVAALLCLKQLDGEKSHPSIAALYSDTDLREFVIRALADRLDQPKDVPANLFRKALKDPNPRVRFQAIVALARFGNQSDAALLFPLAASEKLLVGDEAKAIANPSTSDSDGYSAPNEAIPHTALKAIVKLNAIDYCLSQISDSSYGETALRCLQEIHSEASINGLIKALDRTNDPAVATRILVTLFRLYHKEADWDGLAWWGTRPNHKGPYFKATQWSLTQRIQKAIEKHFPKAGKENFALLFTQMKLNQIKASTLALTIDPNDFDPVLTILDKTVISETEADILANAAMDKERDTAQRIELFHALDRFKGHEQVRMQMNVLKSWGNAKARTKAFRPIYANFVQTNAFIGREKLLDPHLRKFNAPYVIFLNMAANPVIPEASQKEAMKRINKGFNDSNYAKRLVQALAEVDASPYEAQLKKLLETADQRSKKQIQNLLKNIKKSSVNNDVRIASMNVDKAMAAINKTKGNINLGKTLFARQGCVICHAVSQSEPQKGPYLGSAGTQFKRPYIIEAILKPNATISQGFATSWFKLKDGAHVEGFVTRLTADEIDVRNITGQVTTIKAAQIKERGTRSTSMMPAGLVSALTVKEAAALVDYLVSMKGH